LKSAIDKVNKDSGETGIIVAKLKSKRWDTTKSVEFVLEEEKRVKKEIADIIGKWTIMKLDEHDKMSKEDLAIKVTAAATAAKELLETSKKFIKEVLGEFRA
jgi:hypothetical protein